MSSEEENIEIQKQLQALENTARKYLSKEALTRYFTIKSANQEFAIQILIFISQAINQNYIKEKLSDAEFKELLKKLQAPKKDFKIIR
jgi:DNA-binding TFAR19-related protein (PDSD5 family)